jgi:hypothetical protein
MKKTITTFLLLFSLATMQAQSPVGKWKMISHISEYEGQKFDSHKAFVSTRPCASKIFYEINTDKTYRLNAKNSGCDESYKKIQEKLYSESVWTLTGNKITIGHKKAPTVGQTYIVSYQANKMIWKGTEGQGTIIYQKL